jgi:hypothetical protein
MLNKYQRGAHIDIREYGCAPEILAPNVPELLKHHGALLRSLLNRVRAPECPVFLVNDGAERLIRFSGHSDEGTA